jgi:hypothetical protein
MIAIRMTGSSSLPTPTKIPESSVRDSLQAASESLPGNIADLTARRCVAINAVGPNTSIADDVPTETPIAHDITADTSVARQILSLQPFRGRISTVAAIPCLAALVSSGWNTCSFADRGKLATDETWLPRA